MLKRRRRTAPKQRTCLRCDQKFLSAGRYNRLCQKCRTALAESATPEDAYPVVVLRKWVQSD